MGFEPKPQRRGASSFKASHLNHSATEAPVDHEKKVYDTGPSKSYSTLNNDHKRLSDPTTTFVSKHLMIKLDI